MESALPVEAYQDIAALRTQLGRPYEPHDVASGEYRTSLVDAAMEYVKTYTGRFGFIVEIKRDLETRGTLSVGQIKGALNTISAEWYRMEKSKTVETAAIISLPETVNTSGWVLPSGRYTIVHEDGTYRTLRIKALREEQYERYSKPVGTRMAQYLSGPDNGSDYQLFAWILPDGRIQMRGDYKLNSPLMDDLTTLLSFDSAAALDAAREYAKKSNRCSICGADLTNPDSIDASMGPICRGRFL
jgi:hypothetical protein